MRFAGRSAPGRGAGASATGHSGAGALGAERWALGDPAFFGLIEFWARRHGVLPPSAVSAIIIAARRAVVFKFIQFKAGEWVLQSIAQRLALSAQRKPMPWQQNYDPLHGLLSTLAAAVPIVVLLGLLAVRRVPAYAAALAGLAVALGVAIGIIGMPAPMAARAAALGAAYGLLPIG